MSQTFDECWREIVGQSKGFAAELLEAFKPLARTAWNARGAADAEACQAVSDDVAADLWTTHECVNDVKALDASGK